jgi:hypothetical protein
VAGRDTVALYRLNESGGTSLRSAGEETQAVVHHLDRVFVGDQQVVLHLVEKLTKQPVAAFQVLDV